MKKAINEFLQVSFKMPELYNYRYHSRLFGEMPEFKWSNLTQSEIQMDMQYLEVDLKKLK